MFLNYLGLQSYINFCNKNTKLEFNAKTNNGFHFNFNHFN